MNTPSNAQEAADVLAQFRRNCGMLPTKEAAAIDAGITALRAQGEQAVACPTCGESEPRTGACGTSDDDTRALCKRTRPAPADAAGVAEGFVLVPREPTKDWLDVACSLCAVPGYWRDDAKPIGTFISGYTASESAEYCHRYYGRQRLASAYAALIASVEESK